MNPYDRTSSEMKRQNEGPKRFAKGALSLATAAASSSFAPILSRAAPFLSQYIPEDLAIKGLSKISPKLGGFVKKAMDSGFDFDEVKNFIGKQVTESQEASKPSGNIIQQSSPDLFSFLEQKVKSGLQPIQAGAIAQNDKKYSDIIKKLTKQHKTDWSQIIQSVFGEGMAPVQEDQKPIQQGAQQSGGPGEAKLMAVLQQINQMRNGG